MTSLYASNTHAQTAVETFRFLITGSSYDECGKGSLSNITECVIKNSEDSFYVSYTNFDVDAKRIFTRNDGCKFSLEIDTTKNNKSNRFGESQKTTHVYDFTSFYGSKIEPTFFSPTLDGGKSFLEVTLSGVKKISHYYDSTVDTTDNVSLGTLGIISQSMNAGKDRYEAAIRFFKEKYCAGSAF